MPLKGYTGLDGIECPLIYGRGTAPPILFLHGYSFRGTVWLELGFTAFVESLGHAYAAPDMPYGRRTGCTSRTMDIDVNLSIAREALHLTGVSGPALIVAASLGARYAIYLAVAGLADSLTLLAPALSGDKRVWGILRGLRVKDSVVVWGDRDRVVSRREVEEVARRIRARLIIVEGAGHVVYRDAPDLVKSLIREALSSTT